SLSQDARMYNGLKRTGDGKRLVYTIRKGDTLWDISRDYGVTVNQLCAWNGIQPRTILRPGGELVVWSKDKDYAKVIPVSTQKTSFDGESRRINYTVKSGDSLWLIARRHGVTVNELQKWNSLKKKTLLKPGPNLDIYIGQPPTDA
ncbi:MAG: LysM peptidoglycan-binding domain-containing protein, partial [Gammaproteobacteria bacterium]